MRVFVISLLRCELRRAHVDNQMRMQGVPYQFFDAVDGKSGFRVGFDGYDRTQFILRTGRDARPGEIGCFASHRELWKDCVASNEPFVILEDDLDLAPNFGAALAAAERLISRFGFIRLQIEHRGKSLKLTDVDEFALHFYTKVPHGAGGYCISPDVAKPFLETTNTLSMPVDVFIKTAWEHKQPIFGLLPYTVGASWLASQSTIGSRPKAKKSLPERSARFAQKFRFVTRRSRFNRAATRRL